MHVALFLHGVAEQKSIGDAQVGPVKPGMQLHTYELMRSIQTLFKGHRFDTQSLILISHRRPVNPGKHVQVKLKNELNKLLW